MKTGMIGVVGLVLAGVGSVADAFGQETTFIPKGATWHFLDDGSNQGTVWREAGFDPVAEGWWTGEGVFQYGVVGFGPDPENKFTTTYFVTSFDFDGSLPSELSLDYEVDDGAVIYMNGEEVVRHSLPVAGSIFPYNWALVSNRSPTTVTLDSSRLVVGKNIVAVEVHQCCPGSSDLYLALSLRGTEPVPGMTGSVSPDLFTGFEHARLYAPSPAFYKRRGSETDLEWSASGRYYFVTDVDPLTFEPLGGKQFVFQEGGLFRSEIVDLRFHENVKISLSLRAAPPIGGFGLNDSLTLKAIGTQAGQSQGEEIVFADLKKAPVTVQSVLVSEHASKEYFIPVDATLDDAAVHWASPDFDAAGWTVVEEGHRGIGGATGGPINRSSWAYMDTNISDEVGGWLRVLTRSGFSIEDLELVESLFLRVRFSDGFVAYINGQPVASANAPLPTVWNSRPSTPGPSTTSYGQATFDISDSRHLLMNGQNILGIHGLFSHTSNPRIVSAELVTGEVDGGIDLGDLDMLPPPIFRQLLFDVPDSLESLEFVVETGSEVGTLFFMDDVAITGERTGIGFEEWVIANFPAEYPPSDKIPSADPDGDRLPNAAEFYFGLDPLASEPNPIEVRLGDGGALVVSYPRAEGVAVASAGAEWSTDLVSWMTDGVGSVTVVIDVPGGPDTVEVTIPVGEEKRVLVRFAVQP
jgi:hypothetical protein